MIPYGVYFIRNRICNDEKRTCYHRCASSRTKEGRNDLRHVTSTFLCIGANLLSSGFFFITDWSWNDCQSPFRAFTITNTMSVHTEVVPTTTVYICNHHGLISVASFCSIVIRDITRKSDENSTSTSSDRTACHPATTFTC